MQISGEDGVEYRKGSILRLTMKNFVTYTNAEIRPGAQLNVVIGPNGTGKSTLVCAMVLGLGGKPSVLGRAKEPRDFIKHGETSAIVETELYGGRDASENIVIRRKIFNDNMSTWKVNGRESSQKDVLAMVKKLNVQVDNLCQFLPQDRVSSFAAMDPMQLLHETEMAINDSLEDQHQELIRLKKDETESRVTFETQSKVLLDLQAQNEALRRDVQRFQERERLLQELEWLESKRPWVAFEASRLRALELQKVAVEAEKEVSTAEARIAPLEEEASSRRVAAEEGAAVESELTRTVRTMTTQRAQFVEKLTQLAQQTTQLESKLEQVENSEERRLHELARVGKQVEEFRKQISKADEQEPERMANLEKCAERMAVLRDEERSHAARVQETVSKMAPLEEKRNKCIAALKDAERHIGGIKSALNGGARPSMLVYEHIHSAAGKQNLRGIVFGPLALEIVTQSKQYAIWLGKLIPYHVITGFVAEYQQDRDYLQEWCAKNNIIMPNVLFSDNALKEQLKRPLKIAQLQELGLEGYIDGTFDAPPLVKWTLANNTHIHTIPYGHNAESVLAHLNDMKQHTRASDPSSSVIRRCISPTTLFIFKPSSYSSTITIGSNPLKQEMEFVKPSPGIDVANVDAQRLQLEEEMKALREQVDSEKKELQKIKEEMARVKEEHAKCQHSDISSLKKRLAESEYELKSLDKDVAAERDQIKTRIVASLKSRVPAALALRDLTPKWVSASFDSAQHLLKRGFLRGLAEKAAEALKAARAEFAGVRERVQAAKLAFDRAKEETKVLRTEAMKKAERSEQAEAAWQKLPNTLEEIDLQIDNHRVRINAISLNPQIMEKYKQRQQEIESLTEKLANHQNALNEKQERIVQLKAEWLPNIQQFVQDIDTNFATFFKEIGCIGNVKLHADGDDFAHYGIDIWVSYRITDEPKKLDARVQSGGERSVATMLYLIALQQLSDCPFRLVDEINQGMDPHNERMIFDQVALQASKKNTPQYFLITPKLLPDLNFTPAITVLCVFNGPFMVDQMGWKVGGLK